jgi:sulfide:quinone oxidoreductase
VHGVEDVYAAGDATAFPVKQGGIACEQADAAAEAIAARAGAPVEPAPFTPVLRGMLLTERWARFLRRETVGGAAEAADHALWWPPAKIAGRYLGPFLATARPEPLSAELLSDRIAVPGAPLPDSEYQDALELALLLADADARWGDYASALNALDAAEALQGALPPQYEAKRRQWRAAASAA